MKVRQRVNSFRKKYIGFGVLQHWNITKENDHDWLVSSHAVLHIRHKFLLELACRLNPLHHTKFKSGLSAYRHDLIMGINRDKSIFNHLFLTTFPYIVKPSSPNNFSFS